FDRDPPVVIDGVQDVVLGHHEIRSRVKEEQQHDYPEDTHAPDELPQRRSSRRLHHFSSPESSSIVTRNGATILKIVFAPDRGSGILAGIPRSSFFAFACLRNGTHATPLRACRIGCSDLSSNSSRPRVVAGTGGTAVYFARRLGPGQGEPGRPAR